MVRNMLKQEINVQHIKISDLTEGHKNHTHYDGGGHYKLIIVSEDFIDISLIQRHKKIYDILGDMVKQEIHAISITAQTSVEYNNSMNR